MNSSEETEIKKLIFACENTLDLKTSLGNEFYYNSLPLCIIDTVYSLNAKYKSTQNVIDRFCLYFSIKKYRDPKNVISKKQEQFTINNFIKIHDKYDFEQMAEDIYKNKRSTSPKSGILRSEAAYRWSIVLKEMEVNIIQDVGNIIGNGEFESKIKQIPGQRSGISLNYFYMLAGSDEYVKPDVWIKSFVETVLGKSISNEKCVDLVRRTAHNLNSKYTEITPRSLDYAIWDWSHKQ